MKEVVAGREIAGYKFCKKLTTKKSARHFEIVAFKEAILAQLPGAPPGYTHAGSQINFGGVLISSIKKTSDSDLSYHQPFAGIVEPRYLPGDKL